VGLESATNVRRWEQAAHIAFGLAVWKAAEKLLVYRLAARNPSKSGIFFTMNTLIVAAIPGSPGKVFANFHACAQQDTRRA
jgi:hypothetical protein